MSIQYKWNRQNSLKLDEISILLKFKVRNHNLDFPGKYSTSNFYNILNKNHNILN